MLLIFSCFVLVESFSQKLIFLVLCSSFDFLVFYSFVFRFERNLQKNKLSSVNLVLTRFVYSGFSFLSHTARLWYVVFGKLCWLVCIFI